MTPAVTGDKRAAEPDAVRTMLTRQVVGRVTGISNGINNIPTSGYTVVTPSYNTMSYPALDLMAKTEGAQ